MSIDYGARARIGLMVPSGNAICEAEWHAMMPSGVIALMTRLEPAIGVPAAARPGPEAALPPASGVSCDA